MAYELYAHLRYGRGDIEPARDALLRALGHTPLPALSTEYAELCAQTGHVVEAERTALQALDSAQGPQTRGPWLFRLAEAHLLAGDTSKAADILEKAYAEAPRFQYDVPNKLTKKLIYKENSIFQQIHKMIV